MLTEACQEAALEICGSDPDMVIDLCLSNDILSILPNNKFFWLVAGALAVKNKRFKHYEYIYPKLDDNGDYTYLFQRYMIGGEIND